jgi:hypothetical protein
VLGIFALGSICLADPYLDSAVKDGIGIRPLGMGGAFVSVADDSDSVFYNPAGLATAQTDYIRSYMDMNSDVYIRNESYSICANQMGLASWDKEDKNSQKVDVTALAFGTTGDNGVAWGLTYKNIAWTLPDSVGRGWTMDAGFKIPFTQEITGGVLFQDLLKNTVPTSTSVRAGLSMNSPLLKNSTIAVESEFRNLKSPDGADIYLHYGIETRMSSNLVLRGGWEMDHFTAGATFVMGFCTLDYALIVNQDRTNTQMFGFRIVDTKS